MVESWPVTPVGAGSNPVFPEQCLWHVPCACMHVCMHSTMCSIHTEELTIHFPKHNILCTNNGYHVGKHMVFGHKI